MNARTRLTLATAVVISLSVAGCSQDSKGSGEGGGRKNPAAANDGKIAGGAPNKGGTLTILSNQDFAHLDPARNWTMPTMDFGTRLLYRTLTTFKAAPGKEGLEVVPDLATDLGQPANGGRTWTFKLKKGVKYEDGSEVKAQDIKYNVERSFATELTSGPDYAKRYLAGTEGYTGPLKGEHLDSVKTPDDHTIVFELNQPVHEFGSTVTLPTFSPVPASKETGVKYDNHPFSSGPYKIESYEREKKLVLVRNEHWDPATDEVRKAYPDKFVMVMGLKGTQIDDRLIASDGPDASALAWSDLQPGSASKVLTDDEVKKRFVSEVGACTSMLHLNTTKAPFDDPLVREAVQYAVDKESVVTASGGPALNEIATAYMPPALTGGTQPDSLKIPPTGDQEKAKQLLKSAGKENLKVTMTVSTGEKGRGEAIQEALGKAGISVQVDTVDPAAYYDVIGDTKNAPDLAYSGWCPDYPSGATFLPFVFDGRFITEKGNSSNISQFRDQATMDRIDGIKKIEDVAKANEQWAALDAEVMKKAPSIPVAIERKPLLIGTNIAGAYAHPVWAAQLDYATIGLKDPKKSQS
ncbi:ABC transporter substrate-binding protein [Streptomyces sp. NPDC050418]|uniref:ABC transporter substrate-binding protein n=1 Tax=Streptomyces sp. NPDC050418 TaxID=3365612 RepID=UPI00378C3DAF